jgi:hypothetical protein
MTDQLENMYKLSRGLNKHLPQLYFNNRIVAVCDVVLLFPLIFSLAHRVDLVPFPVLCLPHLLCVFSRTLEAHCLSSVWLCVCVDSRTLGLSHCLRMSAYVCLSISLSLYLYMSVSLSVSLSLCLSLSVSHSLGLFPSLLSLATYVCSLQFGPRTQETLDKLQESKRFVPMAKEGMQSFV